MLHGFDDKSAYAMCTFGYTAGPEEEVTLFCGKCPGEIVSPRGDAYFGWDPCFQPNGYKETFAEMDRSIKNTISHRALALQQLQSKFSKQD